ncbi:hypothetical protein M3Y97_00642300 [Aphelenchoides bicaudatus]|nr:hypothetical protein M3Y97_00642300 [Aphelenchoides bicaudatus]
MTLHNYTLKERNYLKVYWPPYWPAVNLDYSTFPANGVSKYTMFPGLMVEIMKILAKDANLTIIQKNDYDFTDRFPFIDLQTLIQLVNEDEIDVIGMGFQHTEKREKLLDFSEYLYNVNTRILRRTKERKFAFLLGWIFLLVFCQLVRYFESHTLKVKPPSLAECAWSILRLQLLQPEEVQFHSFSGNFAICVFSLFQCSILLGVFSSFILASIITRKPDFSDPMIEMIKSIKSGEFYMVTNDPNKWFFEKINSSSETPFHELNAAMRNNPFKVVESRSEVLSLVENDNALLFQQVDEGSYYEAMSRCGITIIEANMPPVRAHLTMRKNHPLMKRLNETIIRNRHRLIGIALKYYRRAQQYDKCPHDGNYRSLTISPFIGLSIFCMSIIVVAFGVFGIEYFSGKANQNCHHQMDHEMKNIRKRQQRFRRDS